jgi:C4-dicarboxylate-specific signal transduction histidine kinase
VVNVDTNQERAVAEKTRRADEPCLQIQPGRDRLRDNDAYGQLRDLVRFSLDLYANRFRLLALQASEKRRDKEPASRKYDRVQEILNEHEPSLPKRAFRELTKEVSAARKASQAEEETIDRRSVMLAPLATAGMVALALNHELSRESAQLERIGDRLRQLASKCSIPELKTAADEFDSARGRLDSLRELFAPLLSEADQTANDRLRVSEVVRQTEAAMKALMPGVRFDKRGIPAALRFPLGSLAEWSALLQNVLANAWNAMLDSRKAVVSFDGGRDRQGREWLRISDTGQGLALPLSGAEKLFEPFERRMKISNDKRSIAIGGHGLGLAIVRMIAHKRSTKVAFVTPEDGFSTTLEISWRGAKP